MVDAFIAAALDTAARVLRSMHDFGEFPDDTLTEEDIMGGYLALALDNVGLPPCRCSVDALMDYAGMV